MPSARWTNVTNHPLEQISIRYNAFLCNRQRKKHTTLNVMCLSLIIFQLWPVFLNSISPKILSIIFSCGSLNISFTNYTLYISPLLFIYLVTSYFLFVACLERKFFIHSNFFSSLLSLVIHILKHYTHTPLKFDKPFLGFPLNNLGYLHE